MARSKTQIQPIRATPAERQAWRDAAAAAGLTISDYVRRSIESAEVGRAPRRRRRPEPPPVDPALDRELKRIGSNINQIARWCNTYGDSIAARRLYVLLDEINDQLAEIRNLAGE